jgi:endonuclease/exonuclease/phosphatase (EEP) superfamily protein YafD
VLARIPGLGAQAASSLGGWLFGSAVLAGLVLRAWLGDRIFLTRYTGYLMPWLLLGLLPGAVRSWLAGRHWLAAVLSASAAIIVVLHAPLFRRPPPVPRGTGMAVRVMSYNTWSRNRDADRIARVVLRERPDVLLLQEIAPDVLARLVVALQTLYGSSPVHLAHEPAIGQAVVSRFPVVSSATLRRKGNAQRVVLRSPAGPVTIFNVHPLRHGGWHRRYSQLAALLDEDVSREPGPVILGGDFNAPDKSQPYRLLTSKLANAHGERGFGFGFTYPASIDSPLGVLGVVPLVRIDHIFVSRQFVTVGAGTVDDSGGSDHRPVYAELAL